MNTRLPPSPLRDLPPERLAQRREHLLAEITAHRSRRRPTLLRNLAVRRRRVLPALAGALVAASLALLLVSPWEGSPSLVERARAAIGADPVLHIVTEEPNPSIGPVLDIETGKVVPQTRQTETWFDEGRALEKTVQRLNGAVTDEVLETPQGGFTQHGPLITCAWIAAHPVEATKLRVSCNENMENGTTPRHIPETPPTVDARLADFVDHYRSALDSGRAREIGRDTIDGRDVIWLRFTWPGAPATTAQGRPNAQEVAVDASSYRPVRLRNADGSWTVDVTVAETVRYSAALFRRPAQLPPQPSIGTYKGRSPIALSESASVLGRAPLWLGQEWQGLRLVGVEKLDLVTGYGALSGRDPTFSSAIKLSYAAEGSPDDKPSLTIGEATGCEMALLWPCGTPVPSEGQLQERYPLSTLARMEGLYLTIHSTRADLDPVTIARALKSVTR
jgi:hypothetical protein